MNTEMSFLFDLNKNNPNSTTTGSTVSTDKYINTVFNNENTIHFKGNENTNSIKGYLSDTSNNVNTYTQVLELLSGDEKLKISSADLAYLENLGVYPVNRLIILRRYGENVIVPNNLNNIKDKNVKPISTVIGWVNDEDESMLDIGFSESWINSTKYIWEVFGDIAKKNFGGKANMTIPSAEWAQGFLYKFLESSGLVEKDTETGELKLPFGDPDYLMVSKIRDIDSQGIESTFSFTLNTSYVQKYINGIDPGDAMLNIQKNLFKMGSSNMKFFLNTQLSKQLMSTASSGSESYLEKWGSVIYKIGKTYINTLSNMYSDITTEATNFINSDTKIEDTKKIISDSFDSIKTELSTALYKYRWSIKGSIGLMTGEPTTPWHVTIGNPLNPIISVGNIVLNNNKITLGNDIGFNDMPTKVSASFGISLGRPLGVQELVEILNIKYTRSYNNSTSLTPLTSRTLDTTRTGLSNGGNRIPDLSRPLPYDTTKYERSTNGIDGDLFNNNYDQYV